MITKSEEQDSPFLKTDRKKPSPTESGFMVGKEREHLEAGILNGGASKTYSVLRTDIP